MSQHLDPTPKQTDLTSLNSNFSNLFTRKTKQYSNITIPSGALYTKIDDYAGLGVSTSMYLISMNIRGWSGDLSAVTLMKGSNGTDIYVAGPAKTLTNFSVEYVFCEY